MNVVEALGEQSLSIITIEDKNDEIIDKNPRSVLTYTNDIGMEFVLVASGSFLMCSSDTDSNAKSDERPQHSVKISKSFYLGKYPVTQAQWVKVMGYNPSKFSGIDDRSVDSVSYRKAKKFISKLNNLEGHKRYRLPTEAEWEYSARGGDRSQGYVYSGSNHLDEVGWYYDNSGCLLDKGLIFKRKTMKNRTTDPVGMKKSNEIGIYDMSGNVYEWCMDKLRFYSASPKVDPRGRFSFFLLSRGGSWNCNIKACRTASRFIDIPNYAMHRFGLRIVHI